MSKGKILFTIPWNYNETGFELESKEQVLFDFMMREKLPFGIRCENNHCIRFFGAPLTRTFGKKEFMAICKETAIELADICNCSEEIRYQRVNDKLKQYLEPRTTTKKTEKVKAKPASTQSETDFSSFFGL